MADKKYSEFNPAPQPQKDQFIPGLDPNLSDALKNVLFPLTKFPIFDIDNPTGTLRIGGMVSIGDGNVPTIPLFVKGATADLIRFESESFECDIKYVRSGTGSVTWESGVGGAGPGGTGAFYWFNAGVYKLSLLDTGILHLPTTGKIGVGILDPRQPIHALSSGASLYTQSNTGIIITDTNAPSLILESAGEGVNEKTFVLKNESGICSFGTVNDIGTTLKENIIAIRRTGKIGFGEPFPDDTLHTLGLPGIKVALLGPFTGGQGPTTISFLGSYLHLGGGEFVTDSYRLISFGFNPTGSVLVHPPAWMGFQETLTSTNTKGALIFGTRDDVLDVAARERMRIVPSGLVGVGIIGIGEKLEPKEAFHVFTGPLASDMTASAGTGIAITNNNSPRLVFEDTGEAVNNQIFVIKNDNRFISFSTMNDDAVTFQNEFHLTIHRTNRVGLNTNDPKETLHVNASGVSLVQFADSGILITDNDNPSVIFEDRGAVTTKRIFKITHEDLKLKFSSFNDAATTPINENHLILDNSTSFVGVNVATPTATFDVNGSLAIGKDRVITGTSNISLEDDYFLLCDTSGGPVTFTIQNVHNTARRSFVIKDMSGNAQTNNITINTQNGDFLIDGVATQLIVANKGAIRLYGDGTEFFVW